MPRHQDNVDVVLTTPTRTNGPPPDFSGRYALDVPESAADATYGERTGLNAETRLFRCQHSSGEVNIQAIISSPHTLKVAVDTAFGPLTTVSFSVPAGSKFTWESVDGHSVTLELAGTLAAAPLEFVCRDETPSEPLWHIDAKANDVHVGTYTVDYRRQDGQPPSSDFKTFTAHASLAEEPSPQA